MKTRLIIQTVIFIIITGFTLTATAQDTLFVDDFENGTGNWNITNDGGTCVWEVWEILNNGYTLPSTALGNILTADSDSCGSETTLLSTATMVNPLNLSNYSSVWIEFDNDWRTVITADEAYVEISADSGNTWITVVSWLGVDQRNTHEVLDVSSYAAFQSDVRFRLRVIQPGWDWWWAVDNFAVYGDTSVVSVKDETSNIPGEFYLSQNYPNPFNPSTIIKYSIGSKQYASLKVYDILGNEVATLINEEKEAGIYEVEFDATGIPSGIYFYRLTAGDPSTSSGQSFTATKKMIILK